MKITCAMVVAMMVWAAGCAAKVKTAPGKAAAEVAVKAEPKKGYRAGGPAVSYGGGGEQVSSAAPAGAFTTIDYKGLHGIVVWLEPVSGTAAASTPQTLTISSPGQKTPDDSAVRVATIGDKIVIHNRSRAADSFYVRFADGRIANIGTLGAGTMAAYTLSRPGEQSVVSESQDRVLDRFFVTPSPLYKVTHCNSTVRFSDLPPGEYRLRSWHYRLPGSSATLNLAPDKVAKATVVIGVNALPKVP